MRVGIAGLSDIEIPLIIEGYTMRGTQTAWAFRIEIPWHCTCIIIQLVQHDNIRICIKAKLEHALCCRFIQIDIFGAVTGGS